MSWPQPAPHRPPGRRLACFLLAWGRLFFLRTAQLMEHEQREGQSTERELDVGERRVRHMRRLVADLLDVSRVTRGKIQLQKRPLELMAVTGYGQSSDRQRSREAGFDAHLVKPVELEAVRTMVVGGASCQGAAFLAKSKNVRTG